MTYAGERLIHDADSHLMEPVDCLDPYFEKRFLERFRALPVMQSLRDEWAEHIDARLAQHGEAAFRAGAGENLLLRKNYEAEGAWSREDRSRALDRLGFASQLLFTTRCLGNFGLDQSGDTDLCYAAADAHNRMITDFCSVDRRLLAVAYVPLESSEQTVATAELAMRLGAKALMVPSTCPQRHAPSHVGLDPLWAMAQEAGLPVLFHVGGEDKLNPVYKENGLPPVPDFHGGDDNFTSVSYMPIPNAAMQTLSTLIFDGVFDRYPRLKFGAIELGANWVPGWMRAMDSAAHAFMRNETRLRKLSARPSEIVRRQFRAAPYPHEDAGWIIRNAGEEVCLFSSDYPHVEGGRNPLKRFDESLKDVSARAQQAFYSGNFIDMMGEGLAADLRVPELQRSA